jgi:lipopolysaccharide transport system ATP-binding protein
MEQPIIEIKNLGKRYNITHQRGGYVSLRDVIMNVVRRPFAFAKTKTTNVANAVLGRSTKEVFWALKNINLEVKAGEVIGIIGPNGAGKSTLLKILSRITPPTEGEAVIRGKLASLLEVGTGFHAELTGRENIFLNGSILGMTRREIAEKFDDIVAFAGIEKFLDTPVKHYSSGMYVRLAFAVAAHLDPDILIVDEVLAVGDLRFRQKCMEKMGEIKNSGKTIIFVSHDLSSIRALCSRVVLLSQGEITHVGETEKIIKIYEQGVFAGAKALTGIADRGKVPHRYFIKRIELKNDAGTITGFYKAGERMHIHFYMSGEAPDDSFTLEYKLYNQEQELISFGSANPIRDTFFKRTDTHMICTLGPLPLTAGKYSFSFSTRVWGQARWDTWDFAIPFEITFSDLFGTGYNIFNGPDGDFVLPQEWSAAKN